MCLLEQVLIMLSVVIRPYFLSLEYRFFVPTVQWCNTISSIYLQWQTSFCIFFHFPFDKVHPVVSGASLSPGYHVFFKSQFYSDYDACMPMSRSFTSGLPPQLRCRSKWHWSKTNSYLPDLRTTKTYSCELYVLGILCSHAPCFNLMLYFICKY